SEVSNTPVMMELRIRTCHVRGSFETRANRAPAISSKRLQQEPAPFQYDRLAHPPATFRQEKLKYDVRRPAARRFIEEEGLNELVDGEHGEVGLILQGGLYNSVIRALQLAGLADAFGASEIPLLVLNVVYPLVPGEIERFCAGKRAVLVIEEGQPEFIELEIAALLRRAGLDTRLHGKDRLPMGGECTADLVLEGLAGFLEEHLPA